MSVSTAGSWATKGTSTAIKINIPISKRDRVLYASAGNLRIYSILDSKHSSSLNPFNFGVDRSTMVNSFMRNRDARFGFVD